MQTIAEKFPELIKEWHPTENGDRTPFNTACYSNKPATWICQKGHVYSMIIANKTMHRQECSYCTGKRAGIDNCLGTLCPDIAKQWHPFKNKEVTPFDVTCGSNKKIWWLCDKCQYEWEASPNKRIGSKRGCPKCAGKVITKENCLVANFPKLVKEWDYEANYPLTPEMFMVGSRKIVSWKCKRGHFYEMRIGHRTTGHGCKFCNNQTSRLQLFFYSELKALFDNVQYKVKVEGMECDIYLPDYKIGIEVDGFYWHCGKNSKDKIKVDKLASKGIRVINIREIGLSVISNDTIRFSKNEDKLEISKKFMELLSTIITDNKLKKYSSSTKPVNENYYFDELAKFPAPLVKDSLAFSNPTLSLQWDYVKNGSLKPKDISANSGHKVYWICENGHSWQATPHNRNSGKQGCPRCWGIRRKNLHNYKIS